MGKITWFPGHMAKAMAALQRVIKGVDLVLEVRDARVPFSSSNPKLDSILRGKRHIIVLNKIDLVPRSGQLAALKLLEQQGLLAFPTSTSSNSSTRQLLSAAVSWIQRERAASDLSIMMVVGLPNSGKSSLINALKLAARSTGVLGGKQTYNRRAAVGATPGLTRQISGFQVCSDPVTYVLDTPGIMVPNIPSDDVGFRLALAGAIKDSVVGEEAIVRFYLHLLATNPQHLAALNASQAPGYKQPSSRDRSSRHSSSAASKASKSMGQALITAAGYTGEVPDSPSLVDWHPDTDDPTAAAAALDDLRLDLLHQQLGTAGGIDPSKQLGCYMRILRAFREGDLGRYMLDSP